MNFQNFEKPGLLHFCQCSNCFYRRDFQELLLCHSRSQERVIIYVFLLIFPFYLYCQIYWYNDFPLNHCSYVFFFVSNEFVIFFLSYFDWPHLSIVLVFSRKNIWFNFFSRKLFIYTGHLPIIGDYLDRFCRNIHSYCSISGVPGFIFLKNCGWQHPEMLVLGFYDSEIAQNINFSNLVNWRKKMHVFSPSGFWCES